jgi:hypothetical protein
LNTTVEQLPTDSSFSQLFHQPKILSSAELKRRFAPIHSSNKKRRHHLIRKTDCIVPLERNLNIPVILQKLFDDKDELSPPSMNQDDCLVPISCSISSIISSKLIHPRSHFDCLTSTSFKTEQENSFSISETIMKQKLKILLQNK